MSRTSKYSRVIVHQFDPNVEISGGIDTCIRGICKYKPKDMTILILGVDSLNEKNLNRKLGRIEHHEIDGNKFDFIPVARLNAGIQKRLIPHSIRLLVGVFIHARIFLKQPLIQLHRTDSLLAISYLSKSKLIQFIHTQEGGLASTKSDSVWRYFKTFYNHVDRVAVARANQVIVFNEHFATELEKVHKHVYFSPTWHDFPLNSSDDYVGGNSHLVSWIGRLEEPKNPLLAIEFMQTLSNQDPTTPWRIQFLGEGTKKKELTDLTHALGLSKYIEFLGYQNKQSLQKYLLQSRLMLITSHKGYEGFPRVILESLSQGVPVIATEGSDTGNLIVNGLNGFNVRPNASDISQCVRTFPSFKSEIVKKSDSEYSADLIVKRLLTFPL
jgi:glycosyltransferase involved in cell wall biosynthesis